MMLKFGNHYSDGYKSDNKTEGVSQCCKEAEMIFSRCCIPTRTEPAAEQCALHSCIITECVLSRAGKDMCTVDLYNTFYQGISSNEAA